MAFRDGILQTDAANFRLQPARWVGDEITPDIVVLHDTASRLTTEAAANYLADNDRKVSVHFVVGRDGRLVQQVPVDKRANHAGRSEYHGRKGCNDFSVGIELVNPGRMTRLNQTTALAWYGRRFGIAEHDIQEIETPEHGHGLWMPHTEAQLDTLIDLLQALFNGVVSLKDIVTHWYVSPGRKVDTNPLFPLEHIRSLILGREDPRDGPVDDAARDVEGDEMVQIEVPGDTLNLRRWPSFNPNVIATIPDGAVLPVLREGRFEGRDWLCVRYGNQEGWIVASYAAPILHQMGGSPGFKNGEKR